MVKSAASVIPFVATGLAYSPLIFGRFAFMDDFWAFLSAKQPLLSNSSYLVQAKYGGRLVGAFISWVTFVPIDSLATLSLARCATILLLGFCALGLSQFMARLGMDRLEAAMLSAAAFTLPAFHSNVAAFTELNIVLGVLTGFWAGMVAVQLADEAGIGWGKALRKGTWAVLILFLGTQFHPLGAMFYFTVWGVWLMGRGPQACSPLWGRIMACLALPVASMLLFYVVYKSSATVDPSRDAHVNLAGIVDFIWQKVIPQAFRFWDKPLLTGSSYWSWRHDSGAVVAILSVAVVLGGLAVSAARSLSARGAAGTVTPRSRFGGWLHALLLVLLLPLTLAPILLAKNPTLNYRYTVGLMPLALFLAYWSLFRLAGCVGCDTRRLRLMVSGMLLVVGVVSAHATVRNEVALPLSSEVEYIKGILASSFKPAQQRTAHFILVDRRFQRLEFPGLMTSYGILGGAWPTGMLQLALRELIREGRAPEGAKDWDTPTINTRVTYCASNELKRGAVVVDPRRTLMLDMTPLAGLVSPWVPAPTGIVHDMALGDTATLTPMSDFGPNLCVGGQAFSGGDYPGFPAAQAFDGDMGESRWGGAQTGRSMKGQAFVGYDFGQGKSPHVRRVVLRQDGAIKGVRVQSSDNGEDWRDVARLTLYPDKSPRAYDLPTSAPARYWRLLADDDLMHGAAWTLYEVMLFEPYGGG